MVRSAAPSGSGLPWRWSANGAMTMAGNQGRCMLRDGLSAVRAASLAARSPASSQAYLETALLLDPDEDVVRPVGGLTTGMRDSAVLMQRPMHDYVRSQQVRSNN